MTGKLSEADQPNSFCVRGSDQKDPSRDSGIGNWSAPVDFLTVRCPVIEPVTTEDGWLESYSQNRKWCYRASFDEPDELFDDISGTSIAVEGVVFGKRFHFTEPDIAFGSHDLTFYLNKHGYRRFGSLEKRGGAWQEIATTGIADPTEVRRVGVHPDRERNAGGNEEYGMAHIWMPDSRQDDDNFPMRAIVHLVCVLPKTTPPETVAELAANHLDVSRPVVTNLIPHLRQQIAEGEITGAEFFRWDGTVGCYMPGWADSVRSNDAQ